MKKFLIICIHLASLFTVSEEIIELRIRIQVFLQPEDSFVLDRIPDLAVRIKEVAEFSGANRTGLDTGRVPAGFVPDTLDAEGAFFNNSLVSGPVAEIMRLGIDLFRRSVRSSPVKLPGAVRAGGHAVPAADAPVIVNHHNAVRFFPCGLGRTGPYAGRIFALLALHRHVEIIFLRNLLRIIVFF